MNKQKRLLELLAIILFIAALCALIWNSNPYDPSKQIALSKTDSAQAVINREHQPPADEKWVKGKTLFKSDCASCHNPKIAQTGPALMGVTNRWQQAGSYQGKTGKQWLYIWIRNWNNAVASGYPYAVHMEHYSETSMNVFNSLSDDDITDILRYIESPDANANKPVAMQ
jgi:cytochrome c2